MRNFIAGLFVAAFLWCAPAAHAQQVSPKPPGVPTAFIQDYNVTSGIWWVGSAVGFFPAVFELHPDGNWYLAEVIDYGYQDPPDLTSRVNAVGGAHNYTLGDTVPKANTTLAHRYPSMGPPPPPTPPANTADALNQALGSYAIKLVNGQETLAPK